VVTPARTNTGELHSGGGGGGNGETQEDLLDIHWTLHPVDIESTPFIHLVWEQQGIVQLTFHQHQHHNIKYTNTPT